MLLAELSSVAAEPFDRELVYFMHRGGMSGAAIARALQIPYGRVLRILRRPGAKQVDEPTGSQ